MFSTIYFVAIILMFFGELGAYDVMSGEETSFTCNLPDIPVVWRYKSDITATYRTVAYLDSNGRYYVDSYSKHKLERDGVGTRLTVINAGLADAGVYYCRKFFNQSVAQQFSLRVVVPPTDLRIEQNYAAEEGELYSLTCVADAVTPVPKMQWEMRKPDGEVINMTSKSVFSVFPYYNTSNKVVSVVGVVLTRAVQGSLLICHTEQSTTQLGVVYTNRVQAHTTNALFKPLTPVLYGLARNLIANKLYTLRCIAGYANPPAVISWYKDGRSWSASRTDVSAFIGYFVTTSYLEINATHLVDNSTFICNVTNPLMSRDKDSPFLVSSTAHVDYAPVIGTWLRNKSVVEGDEFELDCAVKYSKPVASIRWLRNDATVSLTSDRFAIYPYPHTKWTSLTIRSASWQDVGRWRCEAFNTIGIVTSEPIYVDVKHRPYCTTNVTYVTSDLEETATLTCTLNSNPSDDVTVEWTFNNKVVATNQKTEQVAGRENIVSHSIYVETRFLSDYGSFYCTAQNRYGETPWDCEIQLQYGDSESAAEKIPALLAAFGGGTQSYVIISCIIVVAVMLIVLVVVIAVVKKRSNNNNNKESGSIEDNGSPNVYFEKANNSSGLYMISKGRLSDVSLTTESSSKETKSMAGVKSTVSIDNLNELILRNDDFADAYDQYERSRLEVMEVDDITEVTHAEVTHADVT